MTRIDRDIRPLFVPTNVENGGVLNGYPFVREPWTGNDMGDLIVGGKVNLASQLRNAPVAFAVRTMFKLPTADAETGAGTGELDYILDGIFSGVSRRGQALRLCRLAWRGDPDDGPSLRQFALGNRSGLRRARQLPVHGRAVRGRCLRRRRLARRPAACRHRRVAASGHLGARN